MPGFAHDFTANRTTEPDAASLLAQVRGLDPSAGFARLGGMDYRLKKATDWTGPQIQAAQNVLDTAPASTPQLTAQSIIDNLGLVEKAILLTILDQFNLVRSKLSPPLAAITVEQMIAAVRTKAGTL